LVATLSRHCHVKVEHGLSAIIQKFGYEACFLRVTTVVPASTDPTQAEDLRPVYLLDASIISKPETLLRWHRTGFAAGSRGDGTV
jgi:hypothetical protein